MIASWMAYALLVGIVLTISGLALERLASAQGWPLRWIWASTLSASVLLPTATIAIGVRQAPRAIDSASQAPLAPPFTITIGVAEPAPSAIVSADRGGRPSLDRMLTLAWTALTAVFLLRVGLSVVRLRRRARTWERGVIDGVAVRLSSSDGPAVVNLRPMDIVVPRWILALDASLRALVLRHEREHRAARDPYLLFGAAILVAIVPWNVALWFAARRLRLAIEIDCDARVLRAHPSPERYGLLLLTVAQRHASASTLFAPLLSEPTTHLERRILAMQSSHHVTRRVKVAAAIVATGCLALACTFTPAMAQASASSGGAFAAFMASQGFKSWTAVHAARGNQPPRYPEQMRARATDGAVLTSFIVDTAGHIDANSIRILESTNDAFSGAVRDALPSMRFVAAQIDGGKVKQLVQLPFVFGMAGHATLPPAFDTAHTTTRCDRGACPVYRLEPVVTTAAR
jgi:TonB family protein